MTPRVAAEYFIGSSADLLDVRQHGTKQLWLTRLDRRPIKVAAVALANKIARMAWAMMVRGERCLSRGEGRQEGARGAPRAAVLMIRGQDDEVVRVTTYQARAPAQRRPLTIQPGASSEEGSNSIIVPYGILIDGRAPSSMIRGPVV
jgi:hypothetical protein